MSKRLVAAALILASFPYVAQAGENRSRVAAQSVIWRGGYRFRNSPARTAATAPRGWTNNGYRGSTGRTSALDYPPWTQPYSTRINQWNKYPNQPYYLRGERKSLLILP